MTTASWNFDFVVEIDLSGRLQFIDLRQIDLRWAESEFAGVDANVATLGRVIVPVCYREKSRIVTQVCCNWDQLIIAVYRIAAVPVPIHFGLVNAECIKGFPHRDGIAAPGKSRQHTEHHAPVNIVCIKHFAHQSERDAGHLDEPEVERVVIAENLTDPESVHIGKAVE